MRTPTEWSIGAMEASKLLKEKRFWFASIIIVWAAGLQAHMMWMQKQDSFRQKFRDLNEKKDGVVDLNADDG